jgi:hypothetical protein
VRTKEGHPFIGPGGGSGGGEKWWNSRQGDGDLMAE